MAETRQAAKNTNSNPPDLKVLNPLPRCRSFGEGVFIYGGHRVSVGGVQRQELGRERVIGLPAPNSCRQCSVPPSITLLRNDKTAQISHFLWFQGAMEV